MTNQDKERAEFESLFRPKWRKGSHLQRLESGLYLNDNFHAAWEGWQASAERYTSPVEWMSMDSAPKNGTLIRLLVIFEENSIEDESAPAPTIGANSLDQTGVDLWDIAGWDWENDCFTRGIGTPIGWLHITTESIKHQSSRIAELEAEVARKVELLVLAEAIISFHVYENEFQPDIDTHRKIKAEIEKHEAMKGGA